MATGFRNVKALVDAYEGGRSSFCSFRKAPTSSSVSVALNWVDVSMTAGNPPPNYYAASPLVASVLEGERGIFHGFDKSPSDCFLTNWHIMTPSAAALGIYTLQDYLLYYPFIDADSTDEQAMDNTTVIPRYADGNGVKVMAVVVGATATAGTFTFNYVNQDGVSKTSPVITTNTTAANVGTIATSEQAQASGGLPYLRLADGDSGVRMIESVTFIVPSGGLICLVLVRPLSQMAMYEINTPNEINYIRQKSVPPQIYDGAYLNMIANPAGSIASTFIVGNCNFAWSE